MIEVRGVWATYGRLKALSGIDLFIEPQQYIVILGPSGAGKTTLLKVITGLVRQEKGEIWLGIREQDSTAHDETSVDSSTLNVSNYPPEKRNVAFLPQTYALFPHLTVWENVVFGPKVRYWEPHKIRLVGMEILQLVRLDERTDAYPDELSGGMQQRCALARSLVASSKILLLDEPLRALDARLRIELREELRRLSEQLKMTTIHVTHDQEEAMTIADKIVVMNKGRIEQVGNPEDIYKRPITPFVASFVGESNFFPGQVTVKKGNEVTIQVSGDLGTIKAKSSTHVPGDQVVVAIKPERLQLVEQAKSAPNHFTGRVIGIYFLGRFISVKIEIEGIKRHFKLKITSYKPKDLLVGQDIHLTFSMNDCVVFDHDGNEINESFAEE